MDEHLTGLLHRLARLEADNTTLKAKFAALEGGAAPRRPRTADENDGQEIVNRRGLLKGGAAAVAGLGLAGGIGPWAVSPASAATGQPVTQGQSHFANQTTAIFSENATTPTTAFQAQAIGNAGGDGVWGGAVRSGYAGVHGHSFAGPGVLGEVSEGGVASGVEGIGRNFDASGVHGTNTAGGSGVSGGTTGVRPAVSGQNEGSGPGVQGVSLQGRGGVFRGLPAQMRLVPSSQSRPSSGLRGDLVVDSATRLWFCKGGTNWVQLA